MIHVCTWSPQWVYEHRDLLTGRGPLAAHHHAATPPAQPLEQPDVRGGGRIMGERQSPQSSRR
jgi:hypothetical protein